MFREVNWITIGRENLHGRPPSGETPTFSLAEDRGHLVGRCTRVWCVHQQVFELDPILDQHQHEFPKGSQVFSKGPYALKIYNADIYTNAYKQDILSKVVN
ncbi:hypothetical protein H2248_005696 [Termitomyces sp. 'cryptogamus']|nr:hypothetical protein H2248_005696 [Termitomyces sp. 'cryptogamus']